jgi:hypothetical protein
MVIDDKVYQIHNVRVHEFMMGDVDDPDLYAAVPIIDWQKTEKGAWVMEHAVEEPMWHKHIEAVTYGWKFIITAKLKGPDYTFYMLKWGHNS